MVILVPESTQKSKLKGREKSREKILRLVSGNQTITIQEMADTSKMSRAGIEKTIKMLKEEDRLKRIGPGKGGRWELSQ